MTLRHVSPAKTPLASHVPLPFGLLVPVDCDGEHRNAADGPAPSSAP